MDEQKFKEFLKKEDLHPIEVVCLAASELGWQIAIPMVDEDDIVPGISIGSEEYLDELFGEEDQ